jgi:hypothetical protein
MPRVPHGNLSTRRARIPISLQQVLWAWVDGFRQATDEIRMIILPNSFIEPHAAFPSNGQHNQPKP